MAPREKKHSSAPPAGGSGDDAAKKAQYRKVITDLYQANNPEKVKDIDWLMKKYSGCEEELIHAIKLKYNIV
jgi:hypothetical protein